MEDFRILLKNVRPYAGLFAVAFVLMTLVGLFEAGRTALLKSIIDILSGNPNVVNVGLAARIDVSHYLPSMRASNPTLTTFGFPDKMSMIDFSSAVRPASNRPTSVIKTNAIANIPA